MKVAHTATRASETWMGASKPTRDGSCHERGAKSSGAGVANGEGGREAEQSRRTAAMSLREKMPANMRSQSSSLPEASSGGAWAAE